MKAKIVKFAFFALAAAVNGQDVASEFASLVTKYKADVAAVEAQNAAAIARAQQPYLAALDSAERSATLSGNLATTAAITREREAVKKQTMGTAAPAGLPTTLMSIRKACIDGAARVTASQSARKGVDANYLRSLAPLEARAKGNPELLRQIAEEKQKLLAGATGDGVRGKFWVEVDDNAALYVNGREVLTVKKIGTTSSRETILKAGDRLAVDLADFGPPHRFKVAFFSTDKRTVVSLTQPDFKILPDPKAKTFTEPEFADIQKSAKRGSGDPEFDSHFDPFPGKNDSDWVWGETFPYCAIGAVIKAETFKPAVQD